MSATEAKAAGPHAGLLTWLARHGVEYEVREHTVTFTARETARVEGVDPRRFVKTIAVETDAGTRALVVLDAIDHLDLSRAGRLLSGEVRLLTESELLALCPDCDLGTTPAVGDFWNLPVYADFAVREDPEITFHAGSHRFTVTVERATWERAAHVVYGDLATKAEREPAWATS